MFHLGRHFACPFNLLNMFGALFGGLASLAGTFLNGMFSNSANQWQAAQNEKLMRLQDQLQGNRWEQQFNLTNAYNDPSAQLSRMSAAGINPLFDSGAANGNTQATPSPSVSGASVSPSVPQADLSSIISAMMQEKSLQLEDRKTKALEKKTDSDIQNNTAQTFSEIEVNSSKLLSMCKEREKSDADIEKIKADRAAIMASIDQKWNEIQQGFERNNIGWFKAFTQDVTQRWQHAIAERNNALGWYDAGTRRQQVNIERDRLSFDKEKYEKDYNLEVSKFQNFIKEGNIKAFLEVVDKATSTLGGVKMISPNEIQGITAMLTAFNNSASDMSDEDFATVCPKVAKVMEMYMGKTIIGGKKPDSFQYYGPKDVSDGF